MNEELLGLEIVKRGRNYAVKVRGVSEVAGWKRTLGKLVSDRVILDENEGRAFLEKSGDPVVYEVYNLSKSIPKLIEISERTKVYCDVTVLNYGVISNSGFGELFLTYGHDHEKPVGEIYSVLAGSGSLVVYKPNGNETVVVRMRAGDDHLIPPGWIHRFCCGDEGVVLAGFVPHEAGHLYDVVRMKGFPFHLFRDERTGEVLYRRNPRFERASLEVTEAKGSFDAVRKYLEKPMELRRMMVSR